MWTEVAYSAIVPIFIGAVLIVRGLRPRNALAIPPVAQDVATSRRLGKILIVSGLVVGASIVLQGTLPVRKATSDGRQTDDGSKLKGTWSVGEYRNPFLGFRVSYASTWQNVTEAFRGLAKQDPTTSPENVVLLAIARPAADGSEGETDLVVHAESIKSESECRSGGDYLKIVLQQLQTRRDPPYEIKEEPQATIAGLICDRVSLKRRSQRGEIRMTYWAAIKRGYVICWIGVYKTAEELKEIESLLSHFARYPDKSPN